MFGSSMCLAPDMTTMIIKMHLLRACCVSDAQKQVNKCQTKKKKKKSKKQMHMHLVHGISINQTQTA